MTNSSDRAPTGAERLVELLRDEGVDRVFGNPGSTELAFIDAVTQCDDLPYTLGLHEGCVIPMADGYAQATGRVAFVNLHTMSGLGNAVGVLANALANGTPLVVTAGQQERPLLPHKPLLAAPLVDIARPVVKWAAEARDEAEMGVLLRRAFLDAVAPPAGPVFVSIPHDLLLGPAPTPLPKRSRLLGAGVAAGVEEMARMLGAARNPALIVGQELATRDGAAAIVGLAERLGAPLYGAFNMQRGVVPPEHALWRGDLPGQATAIVDMLSGHDCVLYAGGQAFQLFGGAPGPLLPDGVDFIHIAPTPDSLARSQPVTIGAFGDLPATLVALTERLPAHGAPLPSAVVSPVAEEEAGRLNAIGACRILLDALPPDAILHNELPAVGHALRTMFRWTEPDQFYSSKQTIGWAMGAAVGASLGHRRARRSLAIIGDGSAAFSLPALWSAASARVPVIFAIIDNSSYGILDAMTRTFSAHRPNRSPAFFLGDPPIDFCTIARGFGVPAAVADDAEGVRRGMEAALAQDGPFLLHIRVPG